MGEVRARADFLREVPSMISSSPSARSRSARLTGPGGLLDLLRDQLGLPGSKFLEQVNAGPAASSSMTN